MGGRDYGSNALEIVEVVDNNTNCQVNRFPVRLELMEGTNGMVCGGWLNELNILSSCWYLNPNGEWTSGEDMLKKRVEFTITAVEDDVIVIGGTTIAHVSLSSVEKYSLLKQDGWARIKDVPIRIARHCTVLINTTYLMVVGGYQTEVIQTNIKIVKNSVINIL